MENLIFGKWSANVLVNDAGLQKYINLDTKIVYSTQGRSKKSKIHIIERLINTLMRGGTGQKLSGRIIRGRGGCGKKNKMYKFTEEAFALIEKKEKKNPIEVFISALENSAPREETTRVKFGGVVTPIAVDVSPQRRIDFALRNLGKAVVIRSFDNKKSAVQALAEEIILASKNDPTSYSISRKNETERMAQGSR